MRHPDQIFSQLPPYSPSWPKPTSPQTQTWTTSPSLQWKESEHDEKKLTFVLSTLQRTLRFVHKRKVAWPAEESHSTNLLPSEYLEMLLRPIADLFNQLHSPSVLKTPMECIPIAFGESTYGATFTADEFKIKCITAPIVLSLPDNLFESTGKVSFHVENALSKVLEYKPSVPSIIVTNFKDIAVFIPPAWNRPEPAFERLSTSQPSLALRVISAAYLLNALPSGYINVPSPDMEVDEDFILPQGPPQDPDQCLLTDEHIFSTYDRHSDFDFATLVRDRARALQFFRWHDHVQKKYSKLVAHPNDMLTAVTNEVGIFVPDAFPIYPFDASEIPTDTATHLEMIQRESPLVAAGIAHAFERSKSFALKIQNVLAEGSERGICTVYRCQITAIDDNFVTSPPLCLKLFDDRFQKLQRSSEDDVELDERWFDPVVFAEMYAINEAFAYDKLRPVQGSIVPWFYGTHQFTLPDGTVLYGLLMEYIEAFDLDSTLARDMSSDRQMMMIQSCRHAARVLDIADISQRDWHAGQILLHTNPTTKLDHAVLIDFASTTQTWEADDPNFIQNYFGVLLVLLGNMGDVGFQKELVWKYYGEPDDWDSTSAWMGVGPGDKESRHVRAREMFPYISPA